MADSLEHNNKQSNSEDVPGGKQIRFVSPAEGTPAAQALAGKTFFLPQHEFSTWT